MILSRNTPSGASATNVHEARIALGKRLRELRRQAGLSGKQLAESLAWPPSKISKLENGRQTPTDHDVREWTRATESEGETEALLASLHTLEVQHADWQRLFGTGMRAHQRTILETEAKVRFYRVFESMIIPGLLQTPEYARVCLSHGAPLFGLHHDIDEAVQVRMQRQAVLYQPYRRFHFVITEAALRYRLCEPEVMLGQLDRLMSLSTLPTVKLGVIGFETPYGVAFPKHGFWLLDEDLVTAETFSAELNLAQPQEIELYGKIFESLAGIASYGRAARRIIMRVIDDLTPEAEEEME
ncbi:helix-turn-helix domain-containing protein [Lentzea nigeriaca]|nr:transcriptional regulator with XRE-family HTH domain [Lentzea nigeriaca]